MTSETAFYSLFRCIRRSRCRTAMHSIATRTSPSVSVRSRPGSHERAMTPVMSSVPLSSNIINFHSSFVVIYAPVHCGTDQCPKVDLLPPHGIVK